MVQLCFSEFDLKEIPYAMGPKTLQNHLFQFFVFLQIGFYEILQKFFVKLPIEKGASLLIETKNSTKRPVSILT